MRDVRYWIRADPLRSFQANIRAHELYPYDGAVRLQIVLTLAQLVSNRDVELEDLAADRLFAVSRSASPHNPAILLARAEYLTYADRNPEEAEAILADLRVRVSLSPEVWYVEMARALRLKDVPRAVSALREGAKKAGPEYTQAFIKLASSLTTVEIVQ